MQNRVACQASLLTATQARLSLNKSSHMPSTHLVVGVSPFFGVSVQCSTSGVIDGLITSQSVFNHTISSEQARSLAVFDRRGIKRAADGSYRAEDLTLWFRHICGHTLYAESELWQAVTRLDKEGSISLVHIMDALDLAGFVLVSSHAKATQGMAAETYVFRRS
jgi:hypothetical protein